MSEKHYEHFHRGEKVCWIHSEKYLDFWRQQIARLLELKPSDQVLDFACGKGVIFRDSVDKSHLTMVDAFYGENDVVQSDGLVFLEKGPEKTFDKILIKQAVHHFYPDKLQLLLEQLQKVLTPEGKLLILTMPDQLAYPSFEALDNSYENHPFKLHQLEQALTQAQFSFAKELVTFTCQVSKGQYLQSMEECFISTLSQLSESELLDGIKFLEGRLEESILVEDPLVAYVCSLEKTQD